MDERFVGRRYELGQLTRHFEALTAGRGTAVLVLGEAGIGKSELVRQVHHTAEQAHVPVLLGHAVPDVGAPAFWPWLRAFSGPVGKASGLAEGLLVVDPAYDSPAVARFEVVARASERLIAAASATGMVVILEDLQWADAGTLQLFAYLCAEVPSSRLLLIATSRDGLPPLGGRAGPTTLRLEPMTSTEIDIYLGRAVHPSWSQVLRRRTGGNPLYLRELTKYLRPADLRAPVDALSPIPSDLTGLISSRLEQQSSRCRELLDGGSVAGEEFDLEVVDGDPQTAAEAVAAGVLVEEAAVPGRLRWSHAVLREVCYGLLPRSDRINWHQRIADKLEGRGEQHSGERAHHRLRAATDRPSRRAAADACVAAAETATQCLDFDAAALWHTRALPLLHDDAERARTLLSIGRAAFRAGKVREALQRCVTASELAERLGRVDLLAEAAVVVKGVGGLPLGSLLALCERARSALGEEQSARHARVLAQHARVLADALNVEAALPLSEQAMAMALECGDRDALMEALHARHELIGGLDGSAERLSLGARLIGLASTYRRPEAALWGHLWRMDAELQLGATSELLSELFDLEALVNRIGWPLARWHLLRARATRAIQTGRFDQAAQLAVQCQQVAATMQDDAALVQSHLVMTELQTLTGRYEQYVPPRFDWDSFGEQWLPVSCATYGWHEFHAGRLEAARSLFAQVRPRLATLPINARWMPTVMRAAQLAALLHDTEAAELAYRLLLPHSQYFGGQTAAYLGAVPRVLGVLASTLGDHAAADVHGASGCEMERRIGARPFLALAELDHARSLLARGRAGDRSARHDLAESLSRHCGRARHEADPGRRLEAPPCDDGSVGRVRHTYGPGTPDRRAARRWPLQPPHRRAAGSVRAHRRDAPAQHPHQAWHDQPHPGRGLDAACTTWW